MTHQPVVTIMHVDVVGSTQLTTTAGDDVAHAVLDETKQIVRREANMRGGREIDAVGDAMMLTFASPRAAIAGAIAVQDALTARERALPEKSLRVRIGLNVGEVLEREGRPFGAAVNAGARVMAKAEGGEILVSEMVRALAGTVPSVGYRDRGRHAFKGFDEPWRLYQLTWPGAPPKAPRPRRRLSRRFAFGAIVVMAAVGGVVYALVSGGSSQGLRRIEPNHVGLIDPNSGRIERQIAVGGRPVALAASGGRLWVANYADESVTMIEERTGDGATIPVGGHPTALAADAGGAWVAESAQRRLVRVDAQFSRKVASISIASCAAFRCGFGAVVLAGGSLWDTVDETVLEQRDPRSGRLRAKRILDLGAITLAAGGSGVWVGQRSATLVRVDPNLGVVGSRVVLLGQAQALATGPDRLWAVVRGQSWQLQEVDTTTLAVSASSPVEPNAVAVADAGGAAWVANASSGTVTRVDPASHAERTIEVGGSPTALVADTRGLWVAAA